MEELRLQVVIDKDIGQEVAGVVAFGGDFDSDDPNTVIYTHSREVLRFVDDLILGSPFPLVFVTRDFNDLGTFLAATVFLHRDLAINPRLVGLAAEAAFVDEYGVAALAHVDRDLSRFFRFVLAYVKASTKVERGVLENVVRWFREYITEGKLPGLPGEKEIPRVLDHGENGFVVASSGHAELALAWEELFRMGFLRGVVFYQAGEDRWHVLGARKSHYLVIDLQKAAEILNEVEAAMGEPKDWASDGTWLRGPEEGTLIIPSAVVGVLQRV